MSAVARRLGVASRHPGLAALSHRACWRVLPHPPAFALAALPVPLLVRQNEGSHCHAVLLEHARMTAGRR